MTCQDRLSSWKEEVSSAFAHLSKAQVRGLVLWSAGMALTGSSGISQISALLAQVLEQKEGTVFQRLREWYLDAPHKRGDHRRELDVSSCFAPLFYWISRWVGEPGAKWQGEVECFAQKKSRLTCTLLMQWEEGYEHPWAVITDLSPDEARVAWYGLRSWIEASFKDIKSGGLGWHH